jgi:hypothetical protein
MKSRDAEPRASCRGRHGGKTVDRRCSPPDDGSQVADAQKRLAARLDHWRREIVLDPFVAPDYLTSVNEEVTLNTCLGVRCENAKGVESILELHQRKDR